MKSILTTLLAFISIASYAQDKIQISDYEILNNTSWKGTLTYKDYQSGNLTDVDATLQIEIKNHKIITHTQYTYEPQKNNKSSVRIKNDGRYYGNEKVISNIFLAGKRTIKTSYQGRDNNRKAEIIITYSFSDNSFSMTKEVKYEDEELFMRNIYKFKKI